LRAAQFFIPLIGHRRHPFWAFSMTASRIPVCSKLLNFQTRRSVNPESQQTLDHCEILSIVRNVTFHAARRGVSSRAPSIPNGTLTGHSYTVTKAK
jgi:hypothetical protein